MLWIGKRPKLAYLLGRSLMRPWSRLVLIGVCVASGIVLAGWTPDGIRQSETQTPESAPAIPPAKAAVDCPRLESRLCQLVQAADPTSFAAGAQLEYADGRVRVIVELVSVDEPMPAYGQTEEARYQGLVQAVVALDQLCALSNDPAVAAVRSSRRGEPNAGANGPPNIRP
jgi:hypothetical protein